MQQRAEKEASETKREGEISHDPPWKPLFDDRPVQRDSPEKDENKSEGSHKICRGQKT